MTQYIVRRLIILPFLLFGITSVVFVLLQFTPGDPISARYGLNINNIDAGQIARMREQLGLNDPIPVQYVRYVGRLLQGDMGTSINTRRAVADEIFGRFPATLELAAAAMTIIVLFSVPVGILAAIQRGRLIDRLLMGGALIGFSIPGFWLGLMLILLFALNLRMVPTSGRGDGILLDRWQYLILPSMTLAVSYIGFNSRIVRSAALEILNQGYIGTARSKGLRESRILYRHMLPNTLIPIVTLFGLQFAGLLSGVVVVETIFAWPGIGRLTVNSVFQRDYPVIMGTTLLFAVVYILTNLIIDVLYPLIDPRIRLS
jgi:peptide/nickel transport system permease protein